MRYFVIEGKFVDPCPVDKQTLEKSIQEHIVYLDKGFEEGAILVTGPKAAGGGGYFLMKAERVEDIETFLENDPMKRLGVQDYFVNEMLIHKSHPLASEWFAAN